MKKRLLSLLLALVLVLSMVPVGVIAEGTDAHVHCLCGQTTTLGTTCAECGSTAAEWTATDTMPTASGNYYLTADVSTVAVSCTSGDVSICLHGQTVTSTNGNRILNVSTEAIVNITDCTAETAPDGTYTAGIITGCTKDSNGSTLRVLAGGELNFYDGKVTGNTTTGDATIYVDKSDKANVPAGIFNMYGGEISGNTARRGAGVYGVSNGTNTPVIRLLGGTITGNSGTGTGNTGGGAGVVSFRPVEIGGDMKVYGNTAKVAPADLFLRNDGTFTGALVLSAEKPLEEGANVVYGLKNAEADTTDLKAITGAPAEWNSTWISYDGQKVGYEGGKFFVDTAVSTGHIHCLCGKETTEGNTCAECGSEAKEWTGIDRMPAISEPGWYYLTADVSVEPFFVSSGEFAFCLCGHTMTSAAGKRMFSASGGASISFTDCSENVGVITGTTGASNYGSLMSVGTGASLNIYNGKITGNTGENDGLIYVAAGTTEIVGGTLNIYGGEISGNTVKRGILMTALATDGKIPGKIRMLGGTITGNTATGTGSTGGGAGILTFYPLEVGGDAKVYGNTAAAGAADIYLRNEQQGQLVISSQKPLTDGAKLVCSLYTKETDPANLQCVTGAPETWDTAWVTYDGEPLRYEEGKFTIARELVYSGHNHDGQQWISVTNGNRQWPVAEGYYVLEEDVQLDQLLVIPQDTNVHLCLNGKTMTAAEGFHHFDVKAGATLTICDCTAKTAQDGTYTAGQITGANAAAGGAFRVRAGATVNLYDGKITRNYSTSDGGAFYLDGCTAEATEPAVLNMYGGEISYNSSKSGLGGAIRFAAPGEGFSAAVFRMEGGSICNNQSPRYGGALHAPSGATIELLGGIIENNTAEQGGGAVSVNGTSTVTLSGTIIRNNTATTMGGGLYIKSGAVLNMTGGEVSGNSAQVGGGIRVEGAGAALNLQDGKITGNKASGNGGGVFSSANTTVNMAGGQVSGNTSEDGGGGMVLSGAAGNFTGGQISKNQAAVNGGALSLLGSEVTLGKVQIIDNEASGSGGGIYIARAGSINANVIIDGASITGNSCKTYGGGIYLFMNGNALTMESGLIADNYSKGGGGGVLTMRTVTFTMNGGEIRGNSTSNSGGALYASQESTFVMNGGSFTGNYAEKNGGGIYALRATVNLNGGSISYNTAKSACGGVYFVGSTGKLAGVWITNNKCLEGSGGGVMLARAALTINGVKTAFDCHVTMTGGKISGNTTPKAGAGLLVQGQNSTFVMYGGRISENVATKFGAGVYVGKNAMFQMHGGKICYNVTEDNAGGGIRHDGYGIYTGGEIFGNTTTRSAGGMLLSGEGAVVDMKNVKIYDNVGKIAAGVMVQNGATLTMENCEVYGNKATLNGAGVYAYNKSNLTLKNCRIHDNIAQVDGGGFWSTGAAYITLDGCTVENNQAVTGAGGAVWMRGYSLHIMDSTLRNNTAAGNGGAICTALMGTITSRQLPGVVIEDTVLENNTSGGVGGALLLVSGAQGKLLNATFTGNTAAAEGGALWAKDELTVHGLTVTGNASGGEGHAVYLADSGYDGHSFIAGLMKFSGDVKIHGNTGGGLYLGEQTALLIGAEGLGQSTNMDVTLHSGLLTQWVRGAYNYEGGDLVYTITYGDRSITDPEVYIEETVEEPTGQPSEDTTQPTDIEQTAPKGTGGLIVGIIAIVVVIAAAAVIIVLAAKKKKSDK